MNRCGVVLASGLVVVGLGLGGCSPAAIETPTTTAATRTSSPVPATSAATPTPASAQSPTATAEAAPDPCAGLPPQEPAGDDVVERIGGYTILELRDTGRLLYAAGEVTLDETGHPASYVVAEDDTVFGISERFCAYPLYLHMLNSVRRTSFFSSPSSLAEMQLYTGDTLNLDAHTVTSVGDENGVAYDWVPTIYLPPQR